MPQMNTRTVLFIVLLTLLAIPALAAVSPGRITIQSSPTGAIACVDNTSCDITATTITVEGNAWHTVRIMEKGYREWTDTVFVTSGQDSLVDAYLNLDPEATGIRVFVSPTGSTVCLDNGNCRTSVGSANGTFYSGVSPGYHTISVEGPAEFDDTTKLVQVELGKVTVVDVALNAFVAAAPTPTIEKATGTIRVYVDRTGSTVCIDNSDCYINVGGSPGIGTGTAVFSDVRSDEVHIITVAADGFRPVSEGVTVAKDLITTVDVKLMPLPGATTALPSGQVPDGTMAAEQTPYQVPTMPTRSGLGTVPVIGALALCGALFLCRCRRS